MTKVFEDTFTELSNTSLHLHKPDFSRYPRNWEVGSGFNSGTWEIDASVDRAVNGASLGSPWFITLDSEFRNAFIECAIRMGPTFAAYGAVIFRFTDDQNYWYVEVADFTNNIVLYKVEGGVASQEGVIADGTLATNVVRTLNISYKGDNIKVTVDELPALEIDINDSFNNAATRVGIRNRPDRGQITSTSSFDNFIINGNLPSNGSWNRHNRRF